MRERRPRVLVWADSQSFLQDHTVRESTVCLRRTQTRTNITVVGIGHARFCDNILSVTVQNDGSMQIYEPVVLKVPGSASSVLSATVRNNRSMQMYIPVSLGIPNSANDMAKRPCRPSTARFERCIH